MDPVRRWQVATAVTAIAGLGLGAAALTDNPAQEVAPIELELVTSRELPVAPPQELFDRADIVSAEVREDHVGSSASSAVTATSVASADEPAPEVEQEPAPTTPQADDSDDSPDSVDSDDSDDSDD